MQLRLLVHDHIVSLGSLPAGVCSSISMQASKCQLIHEFGEGQRCVEWRVGLNTLTAFVPFASRPSQSPVGVVFLLVLQSQPNEHSIQSEASSISRFYLCQSLRVQANEGVQPI